MISKFDKIFIIGVSYRIGFTAANGHTWAQFIILAQGLNLREGGHSDQIRKVAMIHSSNYELSTAIDAQITRRSIVGTGGWRENDIRGALAWEDIGHTPASAVKLSLIFLSVGA